MARITAIVPEKPRFVKRGFFLLDISFIMCYSIVAATGVTHYPITSTTLDRGQRSATLLPWWIGMESRRAEYPACFFYTPTPRPPRGAGARLPE